MPRPQEAVAAGGSATAGGVECGGDRYARRERGKGRRRRGVDCRGNIVDAARHALR